MPNGVLRTLVLLSAGSIGLTVYMLVFIDAPIYSRLIGGIGFLFAAIFFSFITYSELFFRITGRELTRSAEIFTSVLRRLNSDVARCK